jgi:methylenetetrahydrofolate dehydrogenase (NADP+)/methenyltetrahydrofolate cyclohydrolase
LAPCTPKGVIRLLEYYDIPIRGQDVTMIGASNTVGKPMAIMLLNRGATVSVCHIDTKDVSSYSKKSDIVLVAVGKINLLKADMVKEGAVVVDIGINKNDDGKICGDSDFENLSKKCSAISPVPGGVGPMTVACLIENTLIAFKRQQSISL